MEWKRFTCHTLCKSPQERRGGLETGQCYWMSQCVFLSVYVFLVCVCVHVHSHIQMFVRKHDSETWPWSQNQKRVFSSNKPCIDLPFDRSSPRRVSVLEKVTFLTSKVQCWGSDMAGFGLITGSVIMPLPEQRTAPKQPAASTLCNRMHSSVTARQGNCHLTPTTWQGEKNAHMQMHTNTHMHDPDQGKQTQCANKKHVCTYWFAAHKMSVDSTNPIITGFSENHSEHPCELWGIVSSIIQSWEAIKPSWAGREDYWISTCPWMKVWFHHTVFSLIIKPVCSRIISCFGADQRGVCVCLCLYGHANVGKCVCKGETKT